MANKNKTKQKNKTTKKTTKNTGKKVATKKTTKKAVVRGNTKIVINEQPRLELHDTRETRKWLPPLQIALKVIFVLIGLCVLVLGAVSLGTGADHGIYNNVHYDVRALSIFNIIFGVYLMASPYFLMVLDGPYFQAEKRKNNVKLAKIILASVFIIIGLVLIIGSACVLGNHFYNPGYEGLPIVNIIFGVVLFSSPILFIEIK